MLQWKKNKRKPQEKKSLVRFYINIFKITVTYQEIQKICKFRKKLKSLYKIEKTFSGN